MSSYFFGTYHLVDVIKIHWKLVVIFILTWFNTPCRVIDSAAGGLSTGLMIANQ